PPARAGCCAELRQRAKADAQRDRRQRREGSAGPYGRSPPAGGVRHGARRRRLGLGAALSRAACGDRPSCSAEARAGARGADGGGYSSQRAMWPAGAGTKLPCPRDSALRRAAFSGNLTALPSHLLPAGRSVRVFISANPEALWSITLQ
uniref:Uncharacterized protein n=1 Tax=Equus caballus TaxID=9796 RepID=A0A9L0TH37_HORSE